MGKGKEGRGCQHQDLRGQACIKVRTPIIANTTPPTFIERPTALKRPSTLRRKNPQKKQPTQLDNSPVSQSNFPTLPGVPTAAPTFVLSKYPTCSLSLKCLANSLATSPPFSARNVLLLRVRVRSVVRKAAEVSTRRVGEPGDLVRWERRVWRVGTAVVWRYVEMSVMTRVEGLSDDNRRSIRRMDGVGAWRERRQKGDMNVSSGTVTRETGTTVRGGAE